MAGFVSVNGTDTSVFEGCLFGVVTGVCVVKVIFVVSVLVDGEGRLQFLRVVFILGREDFRVNASCYAADAG